MAENVKIGIDADSSKAENELKKTRRQVERLKDKLAETGKQSKRVEKSGKSMGDTMRGQFRSMVVGAASVTAAVAGIVSVMRALNEERKQAAQGYKQAGMSFGQLAQLAKTPQEFKQLITGSKRISDTGGQTPEQAANLMFALKSGGLEKEMDLLARLRFFIKDVPEVINHVVGLQAALGKLETGGARQLLSKGLVASGVTKTTLSQIMSTAIFPAKQAGAIGMTDEELFAVTALLTKATKSPEIAGTQVQALAAFIEKKGMGGKGMLSAVKEISGKGLTGQKLSQYIPEVRARAGYRGVLDLMSEIEALKKQLTQADIEAKKGRGRVGTMIDVATADPHFKAYMKLQKKTAEEKWAEIDILAKDEMEYQAGKSSTRAKSIRSGEGGVARLVRMTARGLVRIVGGSPETVESVDKALFNKLTDVNAMEAMSEKLDQRRREKYGGLDEYSSHMRESLAEGQVSVEVFAKRMDISIEETKELRKTLKENTDVLKDIKSSPSNYPSTAQHPGNAE